MKIRTTRPAASLGARLRGGGRTMPSGAGWADGGLRVVKVRPPSTSENDAMVCGVPSSSTVKFSRVRSETKRPLSSRGITSVLTRVTPARKVGCCAVTTTEAITTSNRTLGNTRNVWNHWNLVMPTSIMSDMHPSRRQVLGTLAAAGAATLVDPGEVLARLAADVPCAAPSGELVGTLPLFRDRSQVQPFGQKISGAGLDARLITDLSILEPDKLITPNELAYIRTEMPAAAAAHAGAVDDRHLGPARQGRHARPR